MRLVFAFVLIIGVGLAGFAVYMAQNYLSGMRTEVARLQAERAKLPETTRILVANVEKAYGEQLQRDDVLAIVWQKDSVPAGAFVIDEEAPSDEHPQGRLVRFFQPAEGEERVEIDSFFPDGQPNRYLVRSIKKFEPLLLDKVTNPGEDAGITSRLSMGMRAFAIRVDVTSGVSGFLRPGDRVDVYWTGQGATSGILGQEVTKLIQPNIRLIAVDQIADTDRTAPVIARTVTVEATPQEVARLAQAQSTGRLSLSLVGAEDESVAQVTSVDQNTLLGIVEVAPEVVQEERICTTKIRRGADVIEQEIPCTN